MRRWIAGVAPIGAALLLGAGAWGQMSPEAIRGSKLYSDNCSRCHNVRAPRELSDRDWPIVVTHMRLLGGLPGDQARDILAFMEASNNPPPRPAGGR